MLNIDRRTKVAAVMTAVVLVGALVTALIALDLVPWQSSTPTPTPTLIPKPEIKWVEVPDGEFLMGSDPQVDTLADSDEMPQHEVYLDAYRIGKYEVTNAQYSKCIKAEVCEEPSNLIQYTNPDYADHPVVYISWTAAETFCEWVGGRLPTEAEWEKAARGRDGLIYPWGNEFDCSRGNFYTDCDEYDGTSPVGSFPDGASWCRAEDMSGNAWEWVSDWHDGDYYSASPIENPPGSERGSEKVMRGGSWSLSDEFYLRAAYRYHSTPTSIGGIIGFRCVRPPGQ